MDNSELQEKIKEVQSEFSESLKSWSDVLLSFNIKMQEIGITPNRYTDEDIRHATDIFMEVIGNINCHRMIDKNTKLETGCAMAEEMGGELRSFVKKWTGVDLQKTI
jgi:hypothetical protein